MEQKTLDTTYTADYDLYHNVDDNSSNKSSTTKENGSIIGYDTELLDKSNQQLFSLNLESNIDNLTKEDSLLEYNETNNILSKHKLKFNLMLSKYSNSIHCKDSNYHQLNSSINELDTTNGELDKSIILFHNDYDKNDKCNVGINHGTVNDVITGDIGHIIASIKSE
ncbi:unnamed protein product [Schistosoma margrebowiei]|uniref:Uncharacterized protein n=1 Tax=Schistosoma margrebowiei TaxID=48269 RepID=A0A183M1Z1_9TREM|nr:unnamed protein product [Schistosoma margrebowiei]